MVVQAGNLIGHKAASSRREDKTVANLCKEAFGHNRVMIVQSGCIVGDDAQSVTIHKKTAPYAAGIGAVRRAYWAQPNSQRT